MARPNDGKYSSFPYSFYSKSFHSQNCNIIVLPAKEVIIHYGPYYRYT